MDWNIQIEVATWIWTRRKNALAFSLCIIDSYCIAQQKTSLCLFFVHATVIVTRRSLFFFNCLHFALHQSFQRMGQEKREKKVEHVCLCDERKKNSIKRICCYRWKYVYKICMEFQFAMSAPVYVSICLALLV